MTNIGKDDLLAAFEDLRTAVANVRVLCEDAGLIQSVRSLASSVPNGEVLGRDLAAQLSKDDPAGLQKARLDLKIRSLGPAAAEALTSWGEDQLANPYAREFRIITSCISQLEFYAGSKDALGE